MAIARKQTAIVAATVLALTFAASSCGSDTDQATSSPPPPSTSATSDAPSTPATSETHHTSPLEGTWRTDPISLQDAETTLREHGLGRWIERFLKVPPFSGVTVLELSIEDGQWNLYGESDGQAPAPIDYDAEYEIDGDTVSFVHSNGLNSHRWRVEGDTLSLEWVRGTLPPYRGIPDQVFQTALYMTTTFTRQG
jgi:hypothetical protein